MTLNNLGSLTTSWFLCGWWVASDRLNVIATVAFRVAGLVAVAQSRAILCYAFPGLTAAREIGLDTATCSVLRAVYVSDVWATIAEDKAPRIAPAGLTSPGARTIRLVGTATGEVPRRAGIVIRKHLGYGSGGQQQER